MTREDFQQEHGRQLAQVLSLPSFNAALILLGLEVMDGICKLDDDQIRNNSAIILADIRGRLRHEKSMLSLPILTETTPTILQEEYVNAEEEAFEQFNRNHNSQ